MFYHIVPVSTIPCTKICQLRCSTMCKTPYRTTATTIPSTRNCMALTMAVVGGWLLRTWFSLAGRLMPFFCSLSWLRASLIRV